MVVFPNCKINLGLNITRKRNDGFHDIETVFYPLLLHDALEVIKGSEEPKKIHFSTSGKTIQGESAANLCLQAYDLLHRAFPQLPLIRMHLHKAIPVGAGLGGGSSNGAFTLRLLNGMFDLGLSKEELMGYALTLGSDCPFFILNKPCFATGRGEILNQIALDLSPYKLVIVNPGILIKTVEVFSMIKPASPSKSIKEIIKQPVETWRKELKNDFEEAVFKKRSAIRKIKEDLYEAGAVYASMSGSGSTVYGIFQKDNETGVSFPSNYFIKTISP